MGKSTNRELVQLGIDWVEEIRRSEKSFHYLFRHPEVDERLSRLLHKLVNYKDSNSAKVIFGIR